MLLSFVYTWWQHGTAQHHVAQQETFAMHVGDKQVMKELAV
jgi:hypothetical protein